MTSQDTSAWTDAAVTLCKNDKPNTASGGGSILSDPMPTLVGYAASSFQGQLFTVCAVIQVRTDRERVWSHHFCFGEIRSLLSGGRAPCGRQAWRPGVS